MTGHIAIVGAGAMGGYVGGYLARAGETVTLIDPWPDHVAAIRRDGLALEGMTEAENFRVEMRALDISDVPQLAYDAPVDIAFIGVKSYDTAWATTMIAPYLSGDGIVVSLQNCINEPEIAGIVGWGRTLGCIPARIAADAPAPGRVRRNSVLAGLPYHAYRVGEVHGRVTRRAEQLASLLSVADSCRVTTNLWGERWSKLCINGMRNALSAATGLAGNDRDSDPRLRRFGIALGGEAIRVGKALGYSLETIGRHDPEVLLRASEGDADAYAQIEAEMIEEASASQRSADQRPSMGQDILKGRRTEIDQMNGMIVAEAAKLGLAVPANERVVAAVRDVERGGRAGVHQVLD
ncbi:MAG: 2-dehydropantoate 2-reductase [Rhizobiaceae bacterium]